MSIVRYALPSGVSASPYWSRHALRNTTERLVPISRAGSWSPRVPRHSPLAAEVAETIGGEIEAARLSKARFSYASSGALSSPEFGA
jgi:hypothetical protein